jgi:hypothetical protein
VKLVGDAIKEKEDMARQILHDDKNKEDLRTLGHYMPNQELSGMDLGSYLEHQYTMMKQTNKSNSEKVRQNRFQHMNETLYSGTAKAPDKNKLQR